MSANSEYLSKAMANWLRGTTMPAAPATVYVGLATGPILGLTAPSEPAGGSYAREIIVFGNAPTYNDTDGAEISNTADVIFTTATGSWGNITHGFISDAVSGGNVLHKWAWPVSKTISSGDVYLIATGDVTLAY